MNPLPEITSDTCLAWMGRLETLWELDTQFEAAERRWRHINCQPNGGIDPNKRREITEARQAYQEVGLAFYLAAAGENLGQSQSAVTEEFAGSRANCLAPHR